MRTFLLFLFLLAAPAFAADYPGAPASVVAGGYIEADSAGLALSSKTIGQVLRYTIWSDTPGWDSFVVIKSYEIGAVGYSQKRDQASVEITYDVLGEVCGLAFTAKAAKEEVTFEVVKKKGRWKIVSPQLPPHLTVEAAIAFLKTGGPDGKAALQKIQSLQ